MEMNVEKNDANFYKSPSDRSLRDEEFLAAPQSQKLHRQLKNRHVAMIRHVLSALSPLRSNTRLVSVVSLALAYS